MHFTIHFFFLSFSFLSLAWVDFFNNPGTKTLFFLAAAVNYFASHNKFDCLLSVSIQFNYHNNNYFRCFILHLVFLVSPKSVFFDLPFMILVFLFFDFELGHCIVFTGKDFYWYFYSISFSLSLLLSHWAILHWTN